MEKQLEQLAKLIVQLPPDKQEIILYMIAGMKAMSRKGEKQ